MAQSRKGQMCARYEGDRRKDRVLLQHSRFEEQANQARRMEPADEGEASLQAEIDLQQRLKHRRADYEAEIARSQAEEEVSRPQNKKRPAGSDRRQAMTGGDAPSVARVDSAAATPDRRGFFIEGAHTASITRDEMIAEMKDWGRSQTPPEFPAGFSTKRPVAGGFVIHASCGEHPRCNARYRAKVCSGGGFVIYASCKEHHGCNAR